MEETQSRNNTNEKNEEHDKQTSKSKKFDDLRALKVDALREKLSENKSGSGIGKLKITSAPKTETLDSVLHASKFENDNDGLSATDKCDGRRD